MSSPGGPTTVDAMRRLRRRYALVIHGCAAVAVLATALRGRFPFVPMYDPGRGSPPSWLGLTTTWLLVLCAYVAVWYVASRGGRVAEVVIFFTTLLASVWAAWSLLVAAFQVAGIATEGIRFTVMWWLQVASAAAIALAMAVLLRVKQPGGDDEIEESIESDDADRSDGLGRHDGILLPAPLRTFAAVAVAVAALGWVVNAWGLALLAPPSATAEQAVAAVSRAMVDVPTDGILRFQSGLEDSVDLHARKQPRDRWHVVEGIVSSEKPPGYSADLYWSTQVSYRERLSCVSAHSVEKRIVVLAGPCPR